MFSKFTSLAYDYAFMKTGAFKFSNSRNLPRCEAFPAVLNPEKYRGIPPGFKGVYRPGQASVGENPYEPSFDKADRVAGSSMTPGSTVLQP
jgi:hypothetical protein